MIVVIVGILSVLGLIMLDGIDRESFYDCSNLGKEKTFAVTRYGIEELSEIRHSKHIVEAQSVKYYEKSQLDAVRKIDGEQTKEPNPKGKALHVTPYLFNRAIIAFVRTVLHGPSVLDTACLTRIDQLPLENRPPPVHS